MKRLLAVISLLLLGGCGGMRLVESNVTAISTLPPGTATLTGAHYRFERLPSQAEQPNFERVQTAAEAALTHVGLVHDEAGAQYSVLLSASVLPFGTDSWGSPASRGYGGVMIGGGGGGVGTAFGFGMNFPASTSYRREVSVLMRDLHTGLVVYETRATSDVPWADTDNVLPAMFEAALQEFPHPPAGARKVGIEIPR